MHRWCLELGADYLCCPPCLYLCLPLSLSLSLPPFLFQSVSLSSSLIPSVSQFSFSSLSLSLPPLPLTHPPRPAPRDRLFPPPDPQNLLILSQTRAQDIEKTSIFLWFFNYWHRRRLEIYQIWQGGSRRLEIYHIFAKLNNSRFFKK